MFFIYFFLILICLFNFIIINLFAKYFKGSTLTLFILLNMFISVLISYYLFLDCLLNLSSENLISFSWVFLDELDIKWNFKFDTLTKIMLVVVFSVSTCVHFYSIDYMGQDPHFLRFLSYLSLFTFFMIILVTGGNLFQLFAGWEGVGLCSYLLINFWNQRLQANKSALKAMFLNRVADVFLATALFLIYFIALNIDYDIIFLTISKWNNITVYLLGQSFYVIDLITLFFIIGAMGKSAQIGLHTWLPDAMEGPTPVSALIHAATMVTAGIFLIIRCSSLMEYSNLSLTVVSLLGVFTAFMAGTIGAFQNDIKRIIAYSTCSQLGYMVLVTGFSHYSSSMYHLANHAFFKAALFLGAGCVIHSMLDEQDMRKYGSLETFVPFSIIGITVSGASLAGNPYLTGSFSKDYIIEISYTPFTSMTLLISFLAVLTVLFTAYYSNIVETSFEENPDGFRKTYQQSHENSIFMILPLSILTLGGIFLGYYSFDFNYGMGNNFYLNSNSTFLEHLLEYQIETFELLFYLFPFFCGFLGSFLILIFEKNFKLIKNHSVFNFITFFNVKVYSFFNRKWFFDKIYNYYISSNFLKLQYNWSYQLVDRGFLEILGPTGIYYWIYNSSLKIFGFWKIFDFNNPSFIIEFLLEIIDIIIIILILFVIIF